MYFFLLLVFFFFFLKKVENMLIKYTVITAKSLVLVKLTITKYHGSLKSFLASKNFNMEDVIKVLCGESFSSLTSVNHICLEEVNMWK